MVFINIFSNYDVTEYHGHGGLFAISHLHSRDIVKTIIDAAKDIGYPYNVDYNGKTMEGIVFNWEGCKSLWNLAWCAYLFCKKLKH